MDKIRSFLAVDFANFYAQELNSVLKTLQKEPMDVKWVKPESVHLTLNFFGSIGSDTVEAIIGAVEPLAQAQSTFTLSLKGIGVFPNFHHPRVVWVGLAGDVGALKSLKKDLARALEKIGIPPEDRPFKPHLTLGRFRIPPKSSLDRVLEPLTGFEAGKPFAVDRLTLFRSDLSREGPRYTSVHAFMFAGGRHGGG